MEVTKIALLPSCSEWYVGAKPYVPVNWANTRNFMGPQTTMQCGSIYGNINLRKAGGAYPESRTYHESSCRSTVILPLQNRDIVVRCLP